MKPGDLILPKRYGITVQTIKDTSSNYLNIWVKSSNKIGVIIDAENEIKNRHIKILLDGKFALVYKEEVEVIYEYQT